MGRGTVCNDRVWGCGGQSAAAHMGAALREITGGRRIGRGRTPPLRMDRGCGMYWRRGEGTPPYGGGTRSAVGTGRRGRRPLRVHNKWCVGCRRQGEGTPPYGGGTRSTVGAGRRGRRPLRKRCGECGAWGVRIATPACALVRNDILFWGSAGQAGAAGRKIFLKKIRCCTEMGNREGNEGRFMRER